MMTDGHGKFLRLRHVVGQSVSVPQSIRASWQALSASGDARRMKDVRQFMSEMADLQSQAIEAVKRHAGKYVDRILAVAVTDPGLWVEDFDGSRIYCALSDSQRIADLTGLTVIDNFPVNDVLSGGSGNPLEPLPLWLTFADRHQRVAQEHRIVILADEIIRAFLLPASDGLDAELPAIQMVQVPIDQIDDLPGALDGALEIVRHHASQRISSGSVPIVGRTVIFGHPDKKAALQKTLRQRLKERAAAGQAHDQDQTPASLGINDDTLAGTVAAMLGILHIDQMQANLPWLTGATDQRVLGRLTPGTPSNWRLLVREMSDFRPPAMKLKDAV